MKNRQFLIICILIISGFIVLYLQHQEIKKHIDFSYDEMVWNFTNQNKNLNDIYTDVSDIEYNTESIIDSINWLY